MLGRRPVCNFVDLIIGAFLAFCFVVPGTQVQARESDLCVSAARQAARTSGVPFAVLLAIAQTETGRDRGTGIETWPWTLNYQGRGYWLESRAAALSRAQAILDQGETSFDLGCFQINYRWHGQNFSSLDEMLNPLAGAAYAARFLKTLYAETSDWSVAAGAYHSRTPVHAAQYRQRFDQYYAAASMDLPLLVSPSRTNSFPLLQSGSGPSTLGSLVPVFGGG